MMLTTLSLLSFVAHSQAGVIGPLFDSRIVNGEDVKLGEIPYQVSLQTKGMKFHFCGASILNDNYVITAAHCIVDKMADQISVIAGTIDLDVSGSTYEVEKIIMHKSYDPSHSYINDIALLKMKNLFVKSKYVSYVTLPPMGDIGNASDVAVVSGWGRLWEGGPISTKLQRSNIYVADQDYCKNKYHTMGMEIYATQVCAYEPSISKGSCHGDSGGPLTVNGTLIGVVSWANGCASTTYPTVFTRVSRFVDWIEENIM